MPNLYCHAVIYRTVPRYTEPYHYIKYRTAIYSTVPLCTVLYRYVTYNIVQDVTVARYKYVSQEEAEIYHILQHFEASNIMLRTINIPRPNYIEMTWPVR